jgi:hypothetical protein
MRELKSTPPFEKAYRKYVAVIHNGKRKSMKR